MPVTAAEAQSSVMGRNQRKRANIPEALMRDKPSLYIFNIADIPHEKHLGSLGRFLVPACPPGQPYSEPLEIKGVYADEFDMATENGDMGVNFVMGTDVAKAVVGLDSGSPDLGPYTTNLTWQGAFIAAGRKPTEAELQEAHAKFTRFNTMYLQIGDNLAEQGKLAEIPMAARKAVKYLNQGRDWAKAPIPMKDCPACGEAVKPFVAICSHCQSILNVDAAAAVGHPVARQMLAEMKAKLEQQQSKGK
jgi:hypothetical protein